MTSVLLDTHAWVWATNRPDMIPARAQEVIASAEVVRVSTVSIYEVAQKVRLGKWDEMRSFIERLETEIDLQRAVPAMPTPAVCLFAGLLDWPHRDPFDRMIAATALHGGDVLVSADTVFDALRIRRVW